MFQQCMVNLGEALHDFGAGGQLLPHFDKGTNDKHAHRHSFSAVQDRRGHDGSVFGEGRGILRRELELGEVVTVCDYLQFLLTGETEGKVFGEAVCVAFDGLVERFCGHSIKLGQIRIEDHSLTANGQDDRLDGFRRLHGWGQRQSQFATTSAGSFVILLQRPHLHLAALQ